MKKPSWQRCTLVDSPPPEIDAKVKYVSVMVFEKSGKTIVQPLVESGEAQAVQELLENDTLEVWLPNGKLDPAQFDVAILKYKQLMQPYTTCSRNTKRACLKNYFETITSCEQCPLGDNGAED